MLLSVLQLIACNQATSWPDEMACDVSEALADEAAPAAFDLAAQAPDGVSLSFHVVPDGSVTVLTVPSEQAALCPGYPQLRTAASGTATVGGDWLDWSGELFEVDGGRTVRLTATDTSLARPAEDAVLTGYAREDASGTTTGSLYWTWTVQYPDAEGDGLETLAEW